MRGKLVAILLGALLLLPSTSGAFWTENLYAWFDTGYAGATGNVFLGGVDKGNVYWGAMKMFSDPDATYRIDDFYCVDILSYHADGWRTWTVYGTFESPIPPLDAQGYASEFGLRWASQLYNTYAAGFYATDYTSFKSERAALQLAIWEALYDGGPGYAFDFQNGDFWVNTGTNAGIQTMAAGYLDTTGQGVGAYYHDGQDLLGHTPEPATLILTALGLLGGGLASRRRRKS
ncbi:MAG: PEP-CTERM sorting domain-containing protein [Candidatus Eisenbacteria bacterium]